MKQVACFLFLVAGLLAGCATAPIRARVLDAETRQPIPGAVVLGVWTKVVGPLLYHHELVGVRETETDAEGRFELERLPSSGLDGEGDGQAITVYKFGYLAWSNLYLFRGDLRKDQRIPKEILLEQFPADESRAKHISFISDATVSVFSHGRKPKFDEALRREQGLYLRERQR